MSKSVHHYGYLKQNQGMNTPEESDGNEVLETLGTQEYEQELLGVRR